ALLSKPLVTSSAGSSEAALGSTWRRSRTLLAYSKRVSRRRGVRGTCAVGHASTPAAPRSVSFSPPGAPSSTEHAIPRTNPRAGPHHRIRRIPGSSIFRAVRPSRNREPNSKSRPRPALAGPARSPIGPHFYLTRSFQPPRSPVAHLPPSSIRSPHSLSPLPTTHHELHTTPLRQHHAPSQYPPPPSAGDHIPLPRRRQRITRFTHQARRRRAPTLAPQSTTQTTQRCALHRTPTHHSKHIPENGPDAPNLRNFFLSTQHGALRPLPRTSPVRPPESGAVHRVRRRPPCPAPSTE